MKVAFFDVFNPFPINSGGDWYRYHLLSELGKTNEVTGYYNVSKKFDKGFIPSKINFDTQLLTSKINWGRFSKNLEILRPDLILKNNVSQFIDAGVVFFSTVCFPIAKKVAHRNNVPLILFMHNIEWQYLRDNKSILCLPMRAVENHIIKSANAVIALSQHDKEYAERVTGQKVFYCPPMVDREIFSETGPRYNYGSDKFNILFYGSLDRKQNIDAADFVANELSSELSKSGLIGDIRLNMFGSGSPPDFLKDNRQINFLGAVDNPGDYVRGADVVIVPIRNTGGIKIRVLEALACGKPVISTPETADGLPSELRKLVRVANDAKEFAEVISDLMRRPPDSYTAPSITNGNSLQEVIEYARAKACK